jgi:hypothetical protein
MNTLLSDLLSQDISILTSTLATQPLVNTPALLQAPHTVLETLSAPTSSSDVTELVVSQATAITTLLVTRRSATSHPNAGRALQFLVTLLAPRSKFYRPKSH